MSVTYSAGIVTAYGAAKSAGYTGTYAEFCADQAQFAENARRVAEDRAAVEATAEQVEDAADAFTETTVPAAKAEVQQAGATQIQAVQQEGAAQIQDVEAEGAEQVQAVEDKGEEYIAEIDTLIEEHIDDTFTKTGKAADAKATGDRFSAVEDDVSDLKDALEVLQPAATSADVGKALIAKTVENGKVTEYEYGEAGAPPIKDTASGVIASFPDGADNVPMDGVVVTMEPVQDLHGYDNPWPAGGGKNLLAPKNIARQSAPTVTSDGVGGYVINGASTEYAQTAEPGTFFLDAGTYTFIGAFSNKRRQRYGIFPKLATFLNIYLHRRE